MQTHTAIFWTFRGTKVQKLTSVFKQDDFNVSIKNPYVKIH